MMILTDSREKKNAHVLKYFDRNGIQHEVRKLSVGDYMDSERPGLSIDRKRNLQEISGNICTSDGRFMREVRRAHEAGIKLIVLIEHGGKIKSLDDVANWHSKYSRVSGRMLMDRMIRIHIAYGVEFLFCDKKSTGKRIVELLNCEDNK